MRLPRKVLAYIFELVRADIIWLEYLMPVACVCHHWRDVATSCHTLWTDISIHDAKYLGEWLSAVISFSSPLPVNLEVSGGVYEPRPAAVDAFEQLRRIKKLEVDPVLLPEELALLANHNAPLLEHVFIRGEKERHRRDLEENAVVLPTLFNGVHPSLTSMVLSGFVQYEPNGFAQLTKLQLDQQDYRTPADLHALLDLLVGSPQLADLAFTDCATVPEAGELSDWPSTLADRCIYLPRLRRVTFVTLALPLTGVILRSLKLASDKMIAVLYTPHRTGAMLSSWSNTMESDALRRLHCLDPLWSEVVKTATKVEVKYRRPNWSFVVVSPRYQLHFIVFEAELERVYGALEGVVSNVLELWVRITGDPSGDMSATGWFVSKAVRARRICIDGIARHATAYRDEIHVLQSLQAEGPSRKTTLEHCHIFVHDSRWDIARVASYITSQAFQDFPAGCLHLHLEAHDEDYGKLDVWRRRKENSLAQGHDAWQRVEIHGSHTFPMISMPRVLADPPVDLWSLIEWTKPQIQWLPDPEVDI